MWQARLFSSSEALSGRLRVRGDAIAAGEAATLPRTKEGIAARVKVLFLWIKNRWAKAGVDESIFFGLSEQINSLYYTDSDKVPSVSPLT